LIVDDSPAQARLASEPFRARGDEVFVADDGLAGLGMALKHLPDIILSDVQMPKADGWQLLRMIRARKQLSRTPVIFLTTLGSEEDRLKGYRLGVDDYLEKPYSQEVLVAHVERLLQRAAASTTSASWIPRAPDGLRGDLEQVGLPALLSFLEMERKSGVVYLEPRGSLVMLENGRPVRAKTMERDSIDDREEVMYDLLGLARGRFEFVPGEVTEEDSIQTPLSALLMEHARLLDEGARHQA
jgi:CheY-like chemotaxis protein